MKSVQKSPFNQVCIGSVISPNTSLMSAGDTKQFIEVETLFLKGAILDM